MYMKNINGVKVDAMLEVITERGGYHMITESELREPTKNEIDYLKLKKCNHTKQIKQLVYDEPGWEYNLRFCVLCGKSLGFV